MGEQRLEGKMLNCYYSSITVHDTLLSKNRSLP